MFFRETDSENQLSNISSSPKQTANNITDIINSQEIPKKTAENSTQTNISEAYSLSLCEMQQMQRAMEQLKQDLKASESRFR
ncbi:MAG: PAS domain-containing sensor histidine kinase, partial [Microcoleus sp.]